MNNEQQQIIDEAYQNYRKIEFERIMSQNHGEYLMGKKEFVNKIKTDNEFSEKWGLKIEEREFSLEERHKLALPIWKEKYGPLADMMVPTNVDNTPYKIPIKLITLTYKDKSIESYE